MELVVVIIGTLTLSTREAHIARAQKNGYKVTETMTKSTTFLICGKDSEQTIINKAKIFGIRIISEHKWIETLHKAETSKTEKKRARSGNDSKNGYRKNLIYLESWQYKKFWQMRRIYKTTYIRTGLIGTKGMETSREHETKKLAKDSMITLAATKKTSGYKEAKRPQILDYEDSSDSSDENFDDENEYKQKKQRLDNEESESDATLKGDEPSDVDNKPGGAALKEDDDEINEDLSSKRKFPPLPSFVTNPKYSMSIMKGNTVDVLLAFPWKPDEVDPTGWWISEKLDGVRAFWNSKRGKFYSRNGNEFVPPSWFTKGLPRDNDLDGELFGGRGKFQSTISIVKAGVEEWKNITYEVFDVPSLGKISFEDRMNYLRNITAKNKPKYMRLVKQKIAKSERDVYDELERVEGLGAEGLMLRKPGSLYEMGRSKTLLKIKTFHDGEAVVIAHEPGKGKYLRQCGSLLCRMASGKEFKVGSGMNDHDRINPPPIGSIILYKCQELSNSGSPRFPVYLGLALDKEEPTDPDFKQKVKIK